MIDSSSNARAAGRDVSKLEISTLSYLLMSPEKSQAEQMLATSAGEARTDIETARKAVAYVSGTPEEVRREIRSRLKAGESVETVEADLVHRYTTKILAVPTEGRVPKMGMFLVVAMVGAGIFAGTRVAKWRKPATEDRLSGRIRESREPAVGSRASDARTVHLF